MVEIKTSIGNYQTELDDFIGEGNHSDYSLEKVNRMIKIIKSLQWKKPPYNKQNWGIWLHRICPYVGKMKPSMAHWLIKASTSKGDIILDPFCGSGTVLLEANLLERKAIGVDLNPLAIAISESKFDRHPMKYHMRWIEKIDLNQIEINVEEISDFVKQYFHENTLIELYKLRELIFRDKMKFILGCLLGILHGHRPGHLSATTSLTIPFKPKTTPPYKEVIPRLKSKIKRMYKDPFPMHHEIRIFYADTRQFNLPRDSIDAIISSPPYYDTLDYVEENRLRLEFLGYTFNSRQYLKKILIQNKENYLREMKKVGLKLYKFLKPNRPCILVLGDVKKNNALTNTAEEIANIYEDIGFKKIAVVDDEMPSTKSFPSNYKRRKLDRILIMLAEK